MLSEYSAQVTAVCLYCTVQVANAQIEALRSENRLLRKDLMEHIDTIQASGCGHSAMTRAAEVSRRSAQLEVHPELPALGLLLSCHSHCTALVLVLLSDE